MLLRQTLCCAFALLFTSPGYADDRPPQIETLQPGVKFSLVAEHPQLATPTGIDVDSQGRVWLISNHTHFRPDDYVGPEFDEVLIFHPDGHRTVFYNKTSDTMDLELGPDGWVYLAQRARILRIKDTTGDGQADVEEVLFTLTSDAVYPHNGLAGLAWHPNGDLLFGLGENEGKRWQLTSRDGKSLTGMGEGGIFRSLPDAGDLRQIARGLWNPFAVCARSDGQIFAVDNDPGERPPCRLLHIVEHGDYGFRYNYGHEAHHPFVGWNGELRGTLPMIHPSGEAPCGVTPLGRGLLVPSWSEHRLQFFPLSSKGASFSAERVELVRGSRYFRPTCIAPSTIQPDPDTRVWYLTDWVDGRYNVHSYGRLWKLEIDTAEAPWLGPTKLEPRTPESNLATELIGAKHQYSLVELFDIANNSDPFLASASIADLAKHTADWQLADILALPPEHRVAAVFTLKIATDPSYDFGTSPSLTHKPWVAAFLRDSHPPVRFETLRWIADARLVEYLPQVEAILAESDLPFPLFEAAIATHNTLSGQPEAGLRNPAMLLSRIIDSNADPKLRAFALRLLPITPRSAAAEGQPTTTFPDGLTLDLLEELLAVGDSELSLETIYVLSGNPSAGAPLLIKLATNETQTSPVRAAAIAGLAAVAEEHLDLLFQLADSQEKVLREEALRSLRGLSFDQKQTDQLNKTAAAWPNSTDLVTALLKPVSLTSNRPAPTDTAGWLALLEKVPGTPDPAAGGRIFHHARLANCSRCHRHSGRGNVVGPDLSSVGAQSNRQRLLESILEPSREMSPEFRPSIIVLDDGRTFTGIRLRSWIHEVIRDANGQNRSFNLDEVEAISDHNMSFMPNGLEQMLTIRELRDLLAFLDASKR